MVRILYEDAAVIVVQKPAGIESQRGKSFAMDLESELRNLLADRQREAVRAGRSRREEPVYLGVVHRLDRPVSGVMVYARTRAAAAALSRQFAGRSAHKTYEALLVGRPPRGEGRLRDWLIDAAGNTRVCAVREDGQPEPAEVQKAAKAGGSCREAILTYRTIPLKESAAFCLREEGDDLLVFTCGELTGRLPGSFRERLCAVRIDLETGRRHQIRAQFSHAGAPVLGDVRYGAPEGAQMRGKIALCAVRLTFCHPVTGKPMSFEAGSVGRDGR